MERDDNVIIIQVHVAIIYLLFPSLVLMAVVVTVAVAVVELEVQNYKVCRVPQV